MFSATRALSVASRPSLRAVVSQQQQRSMAIAVNQVARVARFHVKGEDEAQAADAIHAKANAILKAEVPGYVKSTRTVCKSEWAYEMASVFEAEAFGPYMESETRNVKMMALLEELKPYIVGELYLGNRVYDEDL